MLRVAENVRSVVAGIAMPKEAETRAEGQSSGPIGRNVSMLRTMYNVDPNCITTDVFVSNLYI